MTGPLFILSSISYDSMSGPLPFLISQDSGLYAEPLFILSSISYDCMAGPLPFLISQDSGLYDWTSIYSI